MGCETTSNVSRPLLTRHILLIDDDTALPDALPETIELRLAQVMVTACDLAVAALDHIETREYDLVITDLNMPGQESQMDISGHARSRHHGHGDDGVEAQARQAGAKGFIRKPFDRNGFMTAIERALGESHR
jgi:DNA-binding NtrC family response regulator